MLLYLKWDLLLRFLGNTNTVTRLASGANLVSAGDFKFTGSGATSITRQQQVV